jgi:hypothetical protein
MRATADMSRYATFAAEDCEGDVGRWIVIDRAYKFQLLTVCFLETDAQQLLQMACAMPPLKRVNCAYVRCQARRLLLGPGPLTGVGF